MAGDDSMRAHRRNQGMRAIASPHTRVGLIAIVACAMAASRSDAQGSKPSGEIDPVPWDLSSPVRPFIHACFEDFYTSARGLSAKEARRWFAEVSGRTLEIGEQGSEPAARAATLKGFARLRAPWPSDAVLRLSFTSQGPLKLHFWGMDEGVTLVAYRMGDRPHWAAYRTTRLPLDPLVIEGQKHEVIDPGLALVSTDDLRAGRSLDGTVEVRHQQGTLVLSKGDVRLLTAPMERPPQEVYLETQGLMLRDVEVYRGEPMPEGPPCSRRVVVQGDRPALLPWMEDTTEDARLARLDDDRVVLTARAGPAPARAWAPLARPGLYAVELEMEGADPGTGVYLGDAEGRPVQGIELVRDPRTGRIALAYGLPESSPALPHNLDPENGPAPLAAPRQWLRLVLAGGALKCWASGDGVQWGLAMPPLAQSGAPASVGLFVRPGDATRRIGLRTLRVRALDGLTGLVRPEALEAALARAMTDTTELGADPGAWQQRVWETLPPGADAAEWRTACALAALIGGADPRLAKPILGELLREVLEDGNPGTPSSRLEVRLRLLEDAALVIDATQWDDGVRLAAVYERLCRAAAETAALDPAGAAQVRRRLASLPIWSPSFRIEPLSERAAREHLAALASGEHWPDVFTLCRQVRLWNQGPEPWVNWAAGRERLRDQVAWLGVQAQGSVPKAVRGQLPRERPTWAHPVVVAPDKDAFNTWAEIRSAVGNGLFADAVRMISTARVPRGAALVADPADPQRFLSVAATAEDLVRHNPPLAQAMRAAMTGAERLRLQQVLATADVSEVKDLAVRASGTPAAAEAHAWLGDRLLASGEFQQAIGHYLDAARADPAFGPLVAPRLRLAGAMMGRDSGEPVQQAVRLGQSAFSPQEFERLAAELREKHAGAPAGDLVPIPEFGSARVSDPAETADRRSPGRFWDGLLGGTHGAASPAPGPKTYEAKPWAVVDGSFGVKPEEVPELSKPLDWPARQMAVSMAGGRMLVANRFQVVAFNLADASVAWRYACESPSHAHGWPLAPMRPLVAGGRVFVRMLPQSSKPYVACLDAASGTLLWRSNLGGAIASDPLVALGRLFVLLSDVRDEQVQGPLWLVELSAATGTVVRKLDLIDVRSEWSQYRACQVAVAEDRIIAALGGAVLCCDPIEGVVWLRRTAWMPPPFDPDAGRPEHQAPLVAGDRVFVTQPGSRAVECLELAGGRLVWRRFVPGLERLVALAGDRLVAATDDQILAMAAGSGEVLWRRDAPDRLDGMALAAGGTLLYLRRQPLGPNDQCPVLAWCDLRDGREVASWPLAGLRAEKPLAGPLVVGGDRAWLFTGTCDDAGVARLPRSIVELTPTGPLPVGPAPASWNAWVEPRLRTAAGAVLPGWTILGGACDERTGFVAPAPSLPQVLVTKAADTPVRLARRVALPAGRRASLALEMGHDAAGSSRVDVRVDGLTLAQTALKPGTPAQPWQSWSVDLTPLAGRTVWLTVVQESASAAPAYAWWKRLEVIDHGP